MLLFRLYERLVISIFRANDIHNTDNMNCQLNRKKSTPYKQHPINIDTKWRTIRKPCALSCGCFRNRAGSERKNLYHWYPKLLLLDIFKEKKRYLGFQMTQHSFHPSSGLLSIDIIVFNISIHVAITRAFRIATSICSS